MDNATANLTGERDTSTATRLTDPRLLTALRVLWVVLVLAALALNIAESVARYPDLYAHPAEQDKAGAEQLGVSPALFTTVQLVENAVLSAGYLVVGLIIFLRRSDDWMAILVSGAVATEGLVVITGVGQALTSVAAIWGTVSVLMVAISALALGVFMMTFPSGRVEPPWLKWLFIALSPTSLLGVFSGSVPGPLLYWIWSGCFLLMLSVGLSSQIYRYRHISTPAQRQQTKWILLGFVGFSLGILIYLSTAFMISRSSTTYWGGVASLIAIPIITLLFLTLPAAIAFSMLRYRLWDIDFLINRSIVYGGMTLLLAAIFVGGFFGLRALLAPLMGSDQPALAAVLPAIAAVLIFNPARLRLRAFIDRRLYHIEIDYREALREHTRRLREHVAGVSGETIAGVDGLEVIGRGGMGVVYRGEDPETGQKVAVKRLPEDVEASSEAYRRFVREAQTIARLDHPNIVRLYRFGEEAGRLYMVMEYVDGLSLSAFVKDRGGLSLAMARPLLENLASALDYAHEQGIVHRDIKSSNVMITPRPEGGWRAVLMDFGIAKIVSAGTRLTATGMMGTLDYVAPEQIQGAADVDARADIYSFGVMTYQMLTGELPFKQSNPGAVVMAHLMQPPPDACEIAPALPHTACDAIQRAMAKKPQERFATAGAFVAALG